VVARPDEQGGVEDVHHTEVVMVARARLAEEMKGPGCQERVERIRRVLGNVDHDDGEMSQVILGSRWAVY